MPAKSRKAEYTVGIIVLGTSASHRLLPPQGRFASNLAAAVAATTVARTAGVEWSELGLGRQTMAGGARWGLGLGAGIACVVAAASRSPRFDPRFVDERVAAHDPRSARFQLAVRIPFETALAEEVIFRGALLGLALRQRSATAAVCTTSVLFGLWHVFPTWSSIDGSTVGAAVDDQRQARVRTVLTLVATTSAAGVAFAVLRLRSGSVLAPVLVHAALNTASFAATRAAHTRRGDSNPTKGSAR